MDTLNLSGTVLGGLGIFLLAIGLMTDGLKLAAGASLRSLLSRWSKTPLRGLFSGFFMTSVVQSSSAVTVASLGFVNAGLISMNQALGIVYGANVGTTMTAWLVALVGFKFNIQVFAMPMIGLGMLLKLTRSQDRLGAFGLALVGFGLFFVGIDVLKGAFEGMVQAFNLSQFTVTGVPAVFVYLLIGVFMTVLTQSSSASIALTITATASGLLGMHAAGAMVIGANIGTTSTAMLAAIGATSNAKRVAAAQVIFNVATALVALLLLPVMFKLIDALTQLFEVQAAPAIALAIFHSAFNILGVLLVFPLNRPLSVFLERRFQAWEDQAMHPRFLDRTIAQTPVLAVNALILELLSIAQRIVTLYARILPKRTASMKTLVHEVNVLRSLSADVSKFIVSIESAALHQETSGALETLMRVDQYLWAIANATESQAQDIQAREPLSVDVLEQRVTQFLQSVAVFMQQTRDNEITGSRALRAQQETLAGQHDAIKSELIAAATGGRVSVPQLSQAIDVLADALHTAQLWGKAFDRLQMLERTIHLDRSPDAAESPSTK